MNKDALALGTKARDLYAQLGIEERVAKYENHITKF